MREIEPVTAFRFDRRVVSRAVCGLLSLVLCAGVAWAVTTQKQNRRRNLVLEGDFTTNDLTQFGGKEALDKELIVVAAPARAGGNAMRVEVNKSEKELGGSRWRAEVTNNGAGGDGGNHDSIRWFGFSTYIPAEWVDDDDGNIIWQIHERPDQSPRCTTEVWRSPVLNLSATGDSFSIKTRWDAKPCSVGGGTPDGSATIFSAPLAKGRWIDWVLKVRWDYRALADGGRGYVEIWKDGVKQPTYRGPNCYNDEREMYLKTGLYRWQWKSENFAQKILFIDEVRMGAQDAGYDDVAPKGTPTK